MAQEIVVVAFDKPTSASELLTNLAAMQSQHQIDLADAVVVTRDSKGKAQLQQSVDFTTRKGAVWGGFWGVLIGLIFGGPIGGLLLGVGVGALVGKLSDAGLSDKWMKEVSDNIPADGSGLFLLVNDAHRESAIGALRPYSGEGKIIHTTLPDEAKQVLDDALTEHDEQTESSS